MTAGKSNNLILISFFSVFLKNLWMIHFRMIHMPTLPESPVSFCTPSQYDTCADKALDELVAKDNDVCVCKTPCTVRKGTVDLKSFSEKLVPFYRRYSKEISLMKLPSESSVDYLSVKFKKTPEYIKEKFRQKFQRNCQLAATLYRKIY